MTRGPDQTALLSPVSAMSTQLVTCSVFLLLLMAGVALSQPADGHRTSRTVQPKAKVLLTVNNYGGYSHPGRRIQVLDGGAFEERLYTDVLGSHTNRAGRAVLNLEIGTLRLVFQDGREELLNRVRYGGIDYWVQAGETNRITRPQEDALRQRSLRSKR